VRNFGYTEDGRVGRLTDLQLWRRLFAYCRRYRFGLAVAVLLSLLVTAATLGLPALMRSGIDHFIMAADLEEGVRLAGLTRTAMEYGVLVLLVFGAGFVQVVLLEYIGQSIMHAIRSDLFAHLLDLDLAFFHSRPAGQLVTRLTNDIQNLHEMFTSVMVTLFNDLLKMAGILVALYWMNIRLALVMSVFVPLSLMLTLLFSRLARERFQAIRSQLARLNGFLQEVVSAITVLQLYGREKEIESRYGRLSHEFYRRTIRQIRLFSTFMPLTELMGTTAVALILWYGGGEHLRGRLTLGELVAFLSYMRLFFQPLRELSQKYSIVQSAMASAERIFDLLDRQSAIPLPVNPWRPGRIQGEIRFQEVCFSYDRDETVLHRIDLHVRPGERVALVGSTGSGKSTLVSLLLRFYDPDSGAIFLDGHDLRSFMPQDLRRAIGIITQDVYILPDTLLANIVLDSHLDEAGIASVIRAAGMDEMVARLADGLTTRIGEGGIELSAGERQLVAFARLVCRDPAILVLDEATASLDSRSEEVLERMLTSGFQDKTMLIIAHRLSTIRWVDRIVVLDRGRIVEQGSHQELMGCDSLYRSLVTMDRQVFSSSGS